MLRITDTTVALEAGRTFRIEGSLRAADVSTLCSVCRAAFEDAPALALDLAGVTFVDAAGARCLARLTRRGAVLTRSTPFIRTVLEQLKNEPERSSAEQENGHDDRDHDD